MSLKLRQGQSWQCGEQVVRIVQLERLEVGYKILAGSGKGEHRQTSKKDFCCLLKGAQLLAAEKPD